MKLFSIIILILLTQSCVKENSTQSYNPQKYYFYLTAAQISQTPYFTNPAFDTISFASNKGDTLTFVKTKTDTTWYCERTTSNPDNNDQNCYQTLHNTYATIKGNGSFDIKHILKGSSYSNKIEYNFNNLRFWAYDDWIGWNGFSTYQENDFINNFNFKSSITIYITPNDTLISDKGFINKDYGLYSVHIKNENKRYTVIIK